MEVACGHRGLLPAVGRVPGARQRRHGPSQQRPEADRGRVARAGSHGHRHGHAQISAQGAIAMRATTTAANFMPPIVAPTVAATIDDPARDAGLAYLRAATWLLATVHG